MTPLSSRKISPCLWFDGDAEDAARFYVALFPDSRIEGIHHNPADGPAGPAGSVLMVAFTLAGQRFLALNGGQKMEHTHAISFQVDCEDQAEVDRLWAAFTAEGRAEQCGWLRDRWGVAWQIVPSALPQLLADPARAPRVMEALFKMVKLDVAALEAAARGGGGDGHG
ncbi:VOC family protein [Xanthobacter autotrophicus DSM 431]|uniref:VOC family protein n=1 Tax=Xanthobacter nonsaccharivorans TaxID=3119912 RepID=UPI00372CABFB